MKYLIAAITLLSIFVLTSCPGVVDTPVPAGTVWTARTLPVSASWNALAYGDGTFVALAYNSNAVLESSDGISWTSGTLPEDPLYGSGFWTSVTYGNGTFVAVSFASAMAATSPDGITWTYQSLGEYGGWNSITYGNGLFVAVSTGGPNGPGSVTSTDGSDWGAFSPLPPRTVANNLAAYGNGQFVALPLNAAVSRISTDGKNWTLNAGPAAADWRSVTYGNGTFVAVASGGDIASTSPDGINWTSRTLPGTADWRAVTHGNGTFVAVASGSSEVAISPDGINWTPHTLPGTAGWSAITYGNGVFVTTAYDSLGSTTAASSL